ncbi:hypothetical protein HYT02_00425 [Candidatus Gottesmanbacteria bacterium]|nr:hypothetical protein [Candidatus Gottesmanbacteria bacterium]
MNQYNLILLLLAGVFILQLTWLLTEPRSLKEIFAKKNRKTYGLTTLAEIGVIEVFQ